MSCWSPPWQTHTRGHQELDSTGSLVALGRGRRGEEDEGEEGEDEGEEGEDEGEEGEGRGEMTLQFLEQSYEGD